MLSLKSSPNPDGYWAAVELGPTVRTVLVRMGNGSSKPSVSASSSFPAQEWSRERLLRISQQFGVKGLPWVLLLNRGEYQLSRVDQPAVAPSELEQSLRWMVPFKEVDPKDASISWIGVPKGGGDRPSQLYVAACSEAMVASRDVMFRSAKLNLRVVDIREMAQRNIAARMPAAGPICMLMPEPQGAQVTITSGEGLYLERFVREQLLGSGVDGEAAPIKRTAIELRRSLEFVRSANPDLAEPEIFVGPGPAELKLAESLSGELGRRVKTFDLGAVFDWPADSPLAKPETQAEFFSVLGACLRI